MIKSAHCGGLWFAVMNQTFPGGRTCITNWQHQGSLSNCVSRKELRLLVGSLCWSAVEHALKTQHEMSAIQVELPQIHLKSSLPHSAGKFAAHGFCIFGFSP